MRKALIILTAFLFFAALPVLGQEAGAGAGGAGAGGAGAGETEAVGGQAGAGGGEPTTTEIEGGLEGQPGARAGEYAGGTQDTAPAGQDTAAMAETDTAAMAETEAGGEMPPTGSPLPLIALAAVILLATGFVLRRVAQRS
jgi:hypothetical protein